jgi:hypothetical protein
MKEKDNSRPPYLYRLVWPSLTRHVALGKIRCFIWRMKTHSALKVSSSSLWATSPQGSYGVEGRIDTIGGRSWALWFLVLASNDPLSMRIGMHLDDSGGEKM